MKMIKTLVIALLLSGTAMAQDLPTSVTAHDTYSDKYGADKAFDGNKNTRWATKDKTPFDQMWIEAQYAKPITVSTVVIKEYKPRISKFELLYKDGKKWKVCLSGTTVGENFEQKLPKAVKSSEFKLNILERSTPDLGITISEISLQ